MRISLGNFKMLLLCCLKHMLGNLQMQLKARTRTLEHWNGHRKFSVIKRSPLIQEVVVCRHVQNMALTTVTEGLCGAESSHFISLSSVLAACGVWPQCNKSNWIRHWEKKPY